MVALFHTVVSRLRALFRRGALDREFEEELAAHLAMAEDEKVRQGMDREAARRAARIELGNVTALREAEREVRGLPWVDTTWLDIKLGLRMLRKSWGLTLIGGLAMTIVMTVGVLVVTFFDLAYGGTLPIEDGERVVAIQTWDTTSQQRRDTAMRDLERWRAELRSLVDVGAFQAVERNLILGEDSRAGVVSAPAEGVRVAQVSAAGFAVMRVPPLLGRALVPDDELPGAPPVVVIGYEVWQARFLGDPDVVGRTLRFGRTTHTIVGVMPEGFAFPVNDRFWTPLRIDADDRLPSSDAAAVFARLAPGFSRNQAHAEVAALGLLPQPVATDDARDARVVPYTAALSDDFGNPGTLWVIRLLLVGVTLLLVPPCANVAILVYARTITRQEEFAARYALGASRGRIVGQLFVEMLVLAGVAAGVALVLVQAITGWAATRAINGLPFWIDFGLTRQSFVFAAVLAVVAALVAGLAPALKATGRRMQTGLHALGNRNGATLGATWTALVVVQVSLSLAALPAVIELTWGTIRGGVLGPGFAAERYLTAQLTPGDDDIDGDPLTRLAAVQRALAEELAAEPGIRGVSFAAPPGTAPWRRIEVERGGLDTAGDRTAVAPAPTFDLVRVSRIDPAFFDVYDMPLLSGRPFERADFDGGRHTVVVNRTFLDRLGGMDNPLGRRIRFPVDEATGVAPPWLEIVGVVADRPAHVDRGTIYLPAPAGTIRPVGLNLRIDADPVALADRLRAVTTRIEPTLRVDEVQTLAAVYRQKQVGNNMGAASLAAVTLSVLLLSAAGIYALTAFTVSQRRREIGIRAALGARPTQLVAGIFRRAIRQLAAGAAGGVLIAVVIDHFLPAEVVGGWRVPGVIPAAAFFMLLVGLVAAAGPARRGLRVEPVEELRNG